MRRLAYHAGMHTPLNTASPHWFLLGAGNMGTLAAWYLTRAGHSVTAIKAAGTGPLNKTLQHGQRQWPFTLPVTPPEAIRQPLAHLLIATKTPYTQAALAPLLPLINDHTLVLRLQNGMGSLDGLIPADQILEAVSTSAVKGQHPNHHIVAENRTWVGGRRQQPPWFASLASHWPNLNWCDDMREPQWKKLVANAVINPLTALHDVPNGHIVSDPQLRKQAKILCAEADRILTALHRHWPGQSLDNVLAVASATAGNTSSMRADRQRGAITEIDAINGWLVTQAKRLGIEAPHNQALVTALSQPATP